MKRLHLLTAIASMVSVSVIASPPSTFSDLDKNGDQNISIQEAQDSQLGGVFKDADTNQDQRISVTEFRAYLEGDDQQQSTMSTEADTDNVSNVVAGNEFNMMDENGDGLVTKSEAAEIGVADTFSDIDLNNDGNISQDEYTKYRKNGALN